MTDRIHLSNPGDVHWRGGNGPSTVTGPCPHATCPHSELSVIAWGPDAIRYELVACDAGCGGQCRAWADSRSVVTSEWLTVQA
jgi:hypothetical protein